MNNVQASGAMADGARADRHRARSLNNNLKRRATTSSGQPQDLDSTKQPPDPSRAALEAKEESEESEDHDGGGAQPLADGAKSSDEQDREGERADGLDHEDLDAALIDPADHQGDDHGGATDEESSDEDDTDEMRDFAKRFRAFPSLRFLNAYEDQITSKCETLLCLKPLVAH